jgi:SAM-dependent methyltransferase
MDINSLSLNQKFDAVLAIDTLYFVDDLQKVLREIFRHLTPGSRFLAFYTQRPRKDIPDLKYDAHGTLLGRALKNMGIHYQWSDYSRAEVDFWNRMDLELQKLKPIFEAEGAKDLYDDRRAETDKALSFIRDGHHCRFLYTVRFG